VINGELPVPVPGSYFFHKGYAFNKTGTASIDAFAFAVTLRISIASVNVTKSTVQGNLQLTGLKFL
jgi:hypothetical protein